MKKRRNLRPMLIVSIIVIIIGAGNYAYSQLPQQSGSYVTKVIDGDTIVVEGGERVRLLYIDTPERGKPCYNEAKNRLMELVYGKDIILEKRGEDRDKYGRLLRYVLLNGTNINLELVEEGLAHMYVYNQGPYHQQFLDAEKLARENDGCIWRK